MTSQNDYGCKTPWCPFHETHHPAETLWEVGPYRIVKCPESGLVFLASPPDNQELTEFYSVQYFEGDANRKGYLSYTNDESVLRRNFRDVLDFLQNRLQQLGKKPGDLTLLEIGCAYGYFLDEARRYFGQVKGIEVNKEVAEIGRQRFALTIDCGPDAIASVDRESVDVVVGCD